MGRIRALKIEVSTLIPHFSTIFQKSARFYKTLYIAEILLVLLPGYLKQYNHNIGVNRVYSRDTVASIPLLYTVVLAQCTPKITSYLTIFIQI